MVQKTARAHEVTRLNKANGKGEGQFKRRRESGGAPSSHVVRRRLPHQYVPATSDVTLEDIALPRARRRCHGSNIAPQSRPAVVRRPRLAGPRLARPQPGHSRPAGHSRRRWPGDGDVATSPSSPRKGDVL